jgi:transcriptional regulator with XRE-family HTH domain
VEVAEADAVHLRRLRHAKGLSHDDLAYEAEVSRSYLSQLEKGTFYASLKMLDKLARVLDVEPAELLRSPQRRKKLDRKVGRRNVSKPLSAGRRTRMRNSAHCRTSWPALHNAEFRL